MRDPEDIHDEWLVLRCQEGDAAALIKLVDRLQPRLWRQAMRLTLDRDATHDVVQQAWVAIIRGLDRLSDAACFRRWAYQIVTYKSADWVRTRQQERAQAKKLAAETTELASAEPAATDTIDGDAADGDTTNDIALLGQALQQLSPDRRAALSMFYLEQMPLAEIAHVLSLPVGTVKSRLHYARQELRTVLERKMR